MAKRKSGEVEKEAVRIIAAMMASSARTAPKTKGNDAIETMVIDGDDLEAVACAMEDEAKEQPSHLAPIFARDAQCVRKSASVLLIGVAGAPPKHGPTLDCGACGYDGCGQLLQAERRQGKDFCGPTCIFRAIDLGIALGSAVKLASELNVDNRVMYTIGAVVKKLHLLDSDVIIGIPLSVSGKNPYFDRR